MNITNDAVTRYINGFYKPVSAELSALRERAEEERVPIILRETESFLAFLLALRPPDSVLEIGTAIGYSAAFFASCGASVTSVEKDEAKAEAARENIERLGLSGRVRICCGDGEEAVNALGEDELFDLVFIDAAKSHYRRFLEAVMPHLAPGALVISDNVLLKGTTADAGLDPGGRFKTNIKRMREYLEFISAHPSLDTVILACGDGLALSRYKA